MNYWVTYPHDDASVQLPNSSPRRASRASARRPRRPAFAGIGFTDHPAPTERWLKAGGHDALDPFAALSFCAAVTDTLRLIPNILVLPYRNPFLVAKAVATIDALSGGRFTLSVATGYLRGEYQALGVDFDQRNARFDEAIEVILGVWSEDDFAYEGSTFTARGQTANPKPHRHPPIWIGGNSRQSPPQGRPLRQRLEPLPRPAGPVADDQDAAPRDGGRPQRDAGRALAVRRGGRAGTGAEIDVSFGTGAGGDPGSDRFDADAQLAALDELAELGVTWSASGRPATHSIMPSRRSSASVRR